LKAGVFDKLQADEEPGIGNKNIMISTSEEKKLAADEELLEDIVQPVEGSYVTNTLEHSVCKILVSLMSSLSSKPEQRKLN
jgi:hypothetical protein